MLIFSIGKCCNYSLYIESDVAPEFTVQRITATIMTVSWSMLTVVEARGFVRNYTIFYFTVSSERQLLNAMSDTVDGNTNKIYIDGLNESLVYSVQMSANTGAGTGARSREITVPLYGMCIKRNISVASTCHTVALLCIKL